MKPDREPPSDAAAQADEWLALLARRPLDAEETTAFQALLKRSPEALDRYLDHCELETWLAAAGTPRDGAGSTGLATAPAPFPASAAPASPEVGADAAAPRRLPAIAWLGLAALATALLIPAWLLTRPAADPGSASAADSATALPSETGENGETGEPRGIEFAAASSADPERPAGGSTSRAGTAMPLGERDPWKTIQGTGAVQHPGLPENAVPELARSERPVKFNRDIRPILSEACFSCHGPDEHGRRAGLRLDLAEGALADLGGHAAIVPGELEQSEVWWRIVSDAPRDQMPPPESHLVLTEEQKDLLRRWIEQGAEYEGHWAYETPRRPEPPATAGDWGRNAIDAFILARLEEEGLAPSPEAEPHVLVRRLHFDLLGLPPSLDETRAFAEDYAARGEAAYEALVDRLLASPHFGERLALPWMDQARYADTNGYSIDGGRDLWLWRDWVIQAYNDNLPFDRFLVEQIAGDLLPDATEGQITATGFNRNHMITHEGGTIPEENLANYAADRVKTTSEVFLGLTMACAQCHDHKYDPISIREYYEFFAFFNELDDRGLDGNAGINARPSLMARTVLPGDELEELRRDLEAARAALAASEEGFPEWLAETRAREAARGEGFATLPLELLDASSPNRPGHFEILEDGTVLLEQPSGGLNAFNHALRLPAGERLDGIRIRIPLHGEAQGSEGDENSEGDEAPRLTPHPDGLPKITTVLASAGDQPAKQVEFYRQLAFERATASSSHEAHPPSGVLDERNLHRWQPAHGDREAHLTLTFAEPLDTAATPYLTVMIFYGAQHAMPHRWRIEGFRGRDTDSDLPGDLPALVARPEAEWSAEVRARVLALFRERAPSLERLRIRVANLEERQKVLTEPHSTMVMNASATPRETHVLDRGQYDVPLEKVAPGTPASLPPLRIEGGAGETPRATRLDLAHWMADPGHPLTARVAVNRLWAMLFGTGIVATTADFGSQGEWPSHPELLDWLAVEFVESGWDQKALLRALVTSAAYRQDSRSAPALRERDPGNRLLARGPRYRLAAEFIRDQALAASGLLVPRVGGPSVHPYQPPGLWKEVSHFGSTPATLQVFVQDHGEKLYRRSLYTVVKRTSPHPAMAAFDAPNREMCITERGATNTPLQALVTLNDPQFAEAARVLAARLLRETSALGDDRARLAHAFAAVTGRDPAESELHALASYLAEERRAYAADPESARQAVTVGESPPDEGIDPLEQAVWKQVATLLLNLSETLTRL